MAVKFVLLTYLTCIWKDQDVLLFFESYGEDVFINHFATFGCNHPTRYKYYIECSYNKWIVVI